MSKRLTAMKAIRQHCLACSSHQPSEVRRCLVTQCNLWHLRMGRNPKPADLIPEEAA